MIALFAASDPPLDALRKAPVSGLKLKSAVVLVGLQAQKESTP